MCGGSTVNLHFCLNRQQSQNTQAHTNTHNFNNNNNYKNREHCTWHIQIDAVCLYSLKCDVLSAWEWERKCQILTLDKHTSLRNVTNDNVTSNSAITVQWSIKSLSLSLCVCSNTVKFQPCEVYVCIWFLYIFSLIHFEIGKQNGRSVHLYILRLYFIN